MTLLYSSLVQTERRADMFTVQ